MPAPLRGPLQEWLSATASLFSVLLRNETVHVSGNSSSRHSETEYNHFDWDVWSWINVFTLALLTCFLCVIVLHMKLPTHSGELRPLFVLQHKNENEELSVELHQLSGLRKVRFADRLHDVMWLGEESPVTLQFLRSVEEKVGGTVVLRNGHSFINPARPDESDQSAMKRGNLPYLYGGVVILLLFGIHLGCSPLDHFSIDYIFVIQQTVAVLLTLRLYSLHHVGGVLQPVVECASVVCFHVTSFVVWTNIFTLCLYVLYIFSGFRTGEFNQLCTDSNRNGMFGWIIPKW